MTAAIALLSDVHANLPALEAVAADITAHVPDGAAYHLGDLVGYGPWPDETVARIAGLDIAGVAGNYDSTVASGYKHCGCAYEDPVQEALAHQSFTWTCTHTSAATKRTLAGLPFRLDLMPDGGHAGGPRVVLVHGTPRLNTVYWHEQRSDEFCLQMARDAGLRAGDLIAFGHTHKPWHRQVEGIHFVNTGSAGRPKDGDWRAGYVLLHRDRANWVPEFRRVEYDLEATVAAMRQAGLPDAFGDQLRTGGAR